jgi:hypothetical protein
LPLSTTESVSWSRFGQAPDGGEARVRARRRGIVAKRFVDRFVLAEAGQHRIDAVVAASLG